jgi:hypothetical protein
MTTTYRARTTIVASVLVLSAVAMVGCSETSSDSLGSTTTTATETVSDLAGGKLTGTSPTITDPTITDTATADVPVQEGSNSAPVNETNAMAQDGNLAELKDSTADITQEGQRFTVLGEPATSCVVGDGWGTSVWAVNDNTSCEFASAVFETQTAGLNATSDNIRDNLKPSIEVTSPVTSQTYTMNCENVDVYVRCTGGNNAAVYFY